MPPKLLQRYLGLLGVPERTPSVEALGELVQAHLCRVPFETISKLYYKRHLGLCKRVLVNMNAELILAFIRSI